MPEIFSLHLKGSALQEKPIWRRARRSDPERQDLYLRQLEAFRQSLDLASEPLFPTPMRGLGCCRAALALVTPPATQARGIRRRPGRSGLDTHILPFANSMWPAPNGEVRGGGVATSLNTVNATVHQDFGTVRGDQIFSSKDTLSAAYTIDTGYSLTPGQVRCSNRLNLAEPDGQFAGDPYFLADGSQCVHGRIFPWPVRQ